jgi:hypothetical protein
LLVEGDLGSGSRFSGLDSILAGGIIIRAMSLLDEAVNEYLENESIELETRNPKLFHRRQKLEQLGLLQDYPDIDKWRDRRNDVGHEIESEFTWDEVEDCLNAVHRELSNLRILDKYPKLKVRKTKQRLPAEEAQYEIEILVTAQVCEGDHIYREYQSRITAGAQRT